MTKLTRLSIALVLLAFPLGLAAQTRIEPQSHAWGSYHWARTSNPFNVKLQSNLTSTWTGYLSTASSDWSASSVLDTTVVAGSTGSTTRRRCSMVTGRVVVCNYTYGNNGWLGLASINVNGSHITQGSVKLNESYSMNSAEKLHVTCQEVGHTFGLGHQSETGASLNTCMDYYQNTSSSDTLSTHPNSHDYSQLATIYSHLDSTNTSFERRGMEGDDDDVPAMTQIDLDGPGQWGEEVDRSEDGRHSTFVLDFGHDRKIITEVLWADDATDENGNLRVREPRVRDAE